MRKERALSPYAIILTQRTFFFFLILETRLFLVFYYRKLALLSKVS